jgi:hypothetical protein
MRQRRSAVDSIAALWDQEVMKQVVDDGDFCMRMSGFALVGKRINSRRCRQPCWGRLKLAGNDIPNAAGSMESWRGQRSLVPMWRSRAWSSTGGMAPAGSVIRREAGQWRRRVYSGVACIESPGRLSCPLPRAWREDKDNFGGEATSREGGPRVPRLHISRDSCWDSSLYVLWPVLWM